MEFLLDLKKKDLQTTCVKATSNGIDNSNDMISAITTTESIEKIVVKL